MRAMFAHLNGDLGVARTEAEEALRFGLMAGHAEARSAFLIMFATVASRAEVRTQADALLAQRGLQADSFVWQSFIGWLALSGGDQDRAARLGAMAMESGVETLPRDQSWFSYLHGFVEMAIELKQQEWGAGRVRSTPPISRPIPGHRQRRLLCWLRRTHARASRGRPRRHERRPGPSPPCRRTQRGHWRARLPPNGSSGCDPRHEDVHVHRHRRLHEASRTSRR